MPVVLYYSNRDFEENEPPELVSAVYDQFDNKFCEIGATCERTLAEGTPHETKRNAIVGYYLIEDDDPRAYSGPTWAPMALIRAHHADVPVFACEDCCDWLAEAFGGTYGTKG